MSCEFFLLFCFFSFSVPSTLPFVLVIFRRRYLAGAFEQVFK